MCGICGYVGFEDTLLLQKMTNVIKHRGPDDVGFFTDQGIGLGMRRLSIIDLESGHQPIHNEDESVWVVFNGEIYNFRDLRDSLLEKGHRFCTNSDTEVIVHAYEEFGDECVNYFHGMFAFAVWDATERKLILARDRFGIKPLHYGIIDGALFFSSEIKSILQHDAYKPTLNLQALHDYLSLLYVPPPQTVFTNIFKIPPSHMLTCKNGGISIKQYYDLSCPQHQARTETFYVEKVRALLEESVASHMVSDVPIGVYLSGGIDSSTITALMTKITGGAVQTYSVGFSDESEFNELDYAHVVSEHLGTTHRDFIVTADAVDVLPLIVKQHDEPFGNATSVLHYLISKEIGQEVKVAMSGTGGDEVFAGYPKYVGVRYAAYYSKLPSVITYPIEKLLSTLPESRTETDLIRWGRMFANAAHLPPAERYYAMIRYFSEAEKRHLYSSTLEGHKFAPPSRFIERLFEKAPSKNGESKVFYTELFSFLPSNILEYTDKTSMAVSLEVRVPFLDHKLVEFSTQIPPSLNLKGLTMKYILKKAVKDLLPRQIIARRKMGFNPPIASWLASDASTLVDEYLSPADIERRGCFDCAEVEKLINRHRSGKENLGLKLWSLIFFECWCRAYMDNA